MKIEGEASYTDIKGKRHKIEGFGDLPDDMELKSIKIEGSIKFTNMTCEEIKIEGECKGQSINAQNFSGQGTVDINNIQITNTFNVEGTVESNSISARKIAIRSRKGSIGTITCDEVKISEDSADLGNSHIFSKMFGVKNVKSKSKSKVNIKSIKSAGVDLSNCEIDLIQCKNAVINSNCLIKSLYVEGNYKIADDSQVSEILNKPFA